MRNVSRLVLAGALMLSGCSAKEAVPADAGRPLVRLDAHLSLGEAVDVGNLTVWPVFSDQPLDIGEFLTLQEALETGVAEVREVAGAQGQVDVGRTLREIEESTSSSPFAGPATNAAIGWNDSDGGAVVNTLVIENKGDLPILMCAGTVVTGGNQDRQIGQDIVVKAGTTVPVDAFCVEEGRWSDERLGAGTGGRFKGAATNATIGVRSMGQYEIAQSDVWLEVAKVKQAVLEKMQGSAGAAAEPAQLASVVDNSSLAFALDINHAIAGEQVDAACKAIRAHFATFGAGHAPVGFAYAINGKPVNVRSFANSRVFERQFGPLLRSMVTESLLAPPGEQARAKASDVVALVRAIQASDEERRETAAHNWNGVRRGRIGFAANCYVPGDGAAGGEPTLVTRDWTARQ